uniref:hypothetical protein n=1 Tax=Enhygromyxa salina TaxID=215803 RepID=UPI001C638193
WTGPTALGGEGGEVSRVYASSWHLPIVGVYARWRQMSSPSAYPARAAPRAGPSPPYLRRRLELGASWAPSERAELLDEIAQLRRQGAFEAALERLRAAEQPSWSRRSRQLVASEIGSLPDRHLRDIDAACVHWRAHRRRHPDGRHDASVARAMERMSCASRR